LILREGSSKNILIAGYYGYNNAGDEVILQGMLAELRTLEGEPTFTVLSGNPERTQSLHNVNAVAWSDITGIVAAVKGSSLVIVGGGGLLQDYWGMDETSFLTRRQGGISEFGAPILLAKLFGIPCMFYAVGVGPLNTPEGQKYTRQLFEAVDRATVRDAGSRELLKSLKVRVGKIPVVPDPGFYAVEEIDKPVFLKTDLTLEPPVIGVSLRFWEFGVDPPDWHPQVSKALDRILEQLGGTVVLVPFQVSDYFLEDDERICIQILAGMEYKHRAIITGGKLDPLQRFGAMAHFDLVLGMRLHSLIGSLRAGIPSVGLMYDLKVKALLEELGLGEYCQPLSDLQATDLVKRMIDAFEGVSVFQEAGEALRKAHATPSKSLKCAKALLEAGQTVPALPPLLVEFAIQQTLNLATVEGEMTQLNTLFRELWSDRKTPGPGSERIIDNLEWVQKQLDGDRSQITKLSRDLVATRERLKSSEIAVKSLEKIVQQVELELREETERRKSSEAALSSLQQGGREAKFELEAITASRGFGLLKFFWGILWRIRDPRQALRELRAGMRGLFWKLLEFFQRFSAGLGMRVLKILPGPRKHLDFVVKAHHLELEDRSRVSLYTDDERIFPDFTPRFAISGIPRKDVKVTLVTTVRDEAKTARAWLKQLEGQSRVPDEVILLDGGSKDETYEILQDYAKDSTLNLRLLSMPGLNIAIRRNLGARMASHPIIAMTDFGCNLRRDWLEKILIPFEHNPEMEVVAGWYQATSRSRLGEWAKAELIPTLDDIYPQSFLPACRSIAFKRSAWEKVGGFAEWLTKTGEDTHFDLKLKRGVANWAFVPDAQVVWHAPSSIKGIWDKLSSWTVGDGESGAFAPSLWFQTVESYRNVSLTLLGLGIGLGLLWVNLPLGILALVLWLLLAVFSLWVDGRPAAGQSGISGGILKRFGRAARVNGFLRGFKNRPAAMERRYADLTGVVLFLSGVPIDDTGGGARGTQIAIELLRRKNLVIFVHKYPKQESRDLGLDFRHERLMHFSAEEFNWEAMQWELSKLLEHKILTAFVEFPFDEYLPIVRSVARQEGQVVYDLIDDWSTSLGGEWYSPAVEERIIKRSSLLVASAPSLAKRLEGMGGRPAVLLPNAVNVNLFNRRKEFKPPRDMPDGKPRIVYIGALWGEWFDWDLLEKLAGRYPQASIILIGDYRGQSPFEASNVHFLGLKPQNALPAYLKQADVAIVPWEISEITQSTSPLKVFEYLAMGLPVVAPKINPLEDIPYVYLSSDHEEFIANIQKARTCEIDEWFLDRFVEANSWGARIEALADHIGGI
jgi:polysaccharide pyruvyl transferase CsaB